MVFRETFNSPIYGPFVIKTSSAYYLTVSNKNTLAAVTPHLRSVRPFTSGCISDKSLDLLVLFSISCQVLDEVLSVLVGGLK